MTAKQGAAKLIVICGAISHHQAPESSKCKICHARTTSSGLCAINSAMIIWVARGIRPYRCDGKARGAFLKRLCAIADLRPLAHVLLYRPLYALAWLPLEWLAAARRRTDAGRSSQENRRAQCAGWQDAHGAGP